MRGNDLMNKEVWTGLAVILSEIVTQSRDRQIVIVEDHWRSKGEEKTLQIKPKSNERDNVEKEDEAEGSRDHRPTREGGGICLLMPA
jgi:hypothetical protein